MTARRIQPRSTRPATPLQIDRRRFLRRASAALVAGWSGAPTLHAMSTKNPPPASPEILTVTGPLPAARLGRTLTHEHILVDFSGADSPPLAYDPDAVVQRESAHLREIARLGVDTLVECTPAYLGRNPLLLRRLSEETGVHLITNTGIYGAAEDRFVPAPARDRTADALAEEWTGKFRGGIGETGIRPGFIKIGVDTGPLSPIDAKLVRAAAMTHRETGLTVACHSTGTPEAMEGTLAILREEGISPQAWIWVHAHTIPRPEDLLPAARAGMWLSFDGLRSDAKRLGAHLDRLRFVTEQKLTGQVLLSHDGGWFDPAKPDGGEHRPYTAALTALPSALEREPGMEAALLDRLLIDNARHAFTIRRRLA